MVGELRMRRCVAFLCVVLCLFMMMTACAPRRYDESNIHKRYNREWIIGKTEAEIVKRYGEFKRVYEKDGGGHLGAYYVNYDNWGMDPSYIHDTYFIEFDENGVAVDAYFKRTSIGG
jgi:hypothetical protein